MTRIDTIMAQYRDGRMTRGEAVAALARVINAENVSEIMPTLSAELASEVERWAACPPTPEAVVLGANLSAKTAQRIAEQERVAGQAIREWVARKGSDGIPASTVPGPITK